MQTSLPASRPLSALLSTKHVIVVGGGPAGLMAADTLSQQGVRVDVYDAMATVGRKFLLAGKGGMNLTHSEDFADFLSRYGNRARDLAVMLTSFDATAVRAWAKSLGIETFVGSSGRVFPVDMKAAPLLRAWLHQLREQGVQFHMKHRWIGWTDDASHLVFATPDGSHEACADAVILALGGGSWARLGSDGKWVELLQQRGVEVAPLQPANCGFDLEWSPFFKEKFAGSPVLTVAARMAGSLDGMRKGQFVITEGGVEGSLIYALSSALREQINTAGYATLELDLMPDTSLEKLQKLLSAGRGSRSFSSYLKTTLKLDALKVALLYEILSKEQMQSSAELSLWIKKLPIRLLAPRPIDEAISSAGGVPFEALTPEGMLKACHNVFCAGEMLDWEAPTGGYLLTACLASGKATANQLLQQWIASTTAAS